MPGYSLCIVCLCAFAKTMGGVSYMPPGKGLFHVTYIVGQIREKFEMIPHFMKEAYNLA